MRKAVNTTNYVAIQWQPFCQHVKWKFPVSGMYSTIGAIQGSGAKKHESSQLVHSYSGYLHASTREGQKEFMSTISSLLLVLWLHTN